MPWQDCSVEQQRLRLVKALAAAREPVELTCRRFNVSRQTAAKFRRRWLAEGLAGLHDKSRQPRTSAVLAGRWRRRLLRLREMNPTWGPRKLRWLLQRRFSGPLPAERTLQRWLAAAGLSQRPGRQRRRVTLRRDVVATAAHAANAVWTIDLKGWFSTGDGCKVEPLTVRDLASRFVLWARPLAPRDERRVRRVCSQLFRRHGRPGVMRCDLGAPFFGDGPHGFTRLTLWWWRLGIRVEFVRRGVIDNNAHEQMHRILKDEVAIARTPALQALALERWRRRYNQRRPHEALDQQPPATVYRSSPAPLPRLLLPHYPKTWLLRRVHRNGEIYLPGWKGTIGRAFAGLQIGLQPVTAHVYRVYFSTLLLGELDLLRTRKLVLHPA
jgi:putative transposase